MTKGVCWSEKYDSRSWAEHWSCQEQWTGLEVIPAVLGFYVGFGGGSLVGNGAIVTDRLSRDFM